MSKSKSKSKEDELRELLGSREEAAKTWVGTTTTPESLAEVLSDKVQAEAAKLLAEIVEIINEMSEEPVLAIVFGVLQGSVERENAAGVNLETEATAFLWGLPDGVKQLIHAAVSESSLVKAAGRER